MLIVMLLNFARHSSYSVHNILTVDLFVLFCVDDLITIQILSTLFRSVVEKDRLSLSILRYRYNDHTGQCMDTCK